MSTNSHRIRTRNLVTIEDKYVVKTFVDASRCENEIRSLEFMRVQLGESHLPIVDTIAPHTIRFKRQIGYCQLDSFDLRIQQTVITQLLRDMDSARRKCAVQNPRYEYRISCDNALTLRTLNRRNAESGWYNLETYDTIESIASLYKARVPLSFVHGDLRLSNVLYSAVENNYVVIDHEFGQTCSDSNVDYAQLAGDIEFHANPLWEWIEKEVENGYGFHYDSYLFYRVKYYVGILGLASVSRSVVLRHLLRLIS